LRFGTTGNLIVTSTTTELNLVRQGITTFITSGSGGNAGVGTISNAAFTFFTNNGAKAQITAGGNFLIGTTTDAGFKLDVNGTARVSGVLSATGNYIQYGTNLNVGIGSTNNGSSFSNSGVGFLYATANVNNIIMYGHNYFTGAYNATSGIQGAVGFTGATFNPASGTAVFNTMNLTATINQTGGANGITRGLYINPTLTAAADFRAIEVTAGTTVLAPSVTARASLRIPSGTAPTSPVNGDIWFDGTLLKMQIGGVTKTFTII